MSRIYHYHCGSCGNRFSDTKQTKWVRCPKCGATGDEGYVNLDKEKN